MRMTRRQATSWIAVVLLGAVLIARTPAGTTIRLVDGVVHVGTFDDPPPSRPCPTVAALSLEDLESQDTTCRLSGAVVVVPGDVVREPGGGPVPPTVLVSIPEPGVIEERAGDACAGEIGVAHFSGDLGVVVYTRRHAWGLPKVVERFRERELLDSPILEPVSETGIPGPW